MLIFDSLLLWMVLQQKCNYGENIGYMR